MKLTDEFFVYPWESMTENNCNSYVIGKKEKILIDPGHYHLLPRLEQKMKEDGISFDDISLVLVTHPHPDHMEGIAAWNQRPALIALHPDALDFIEQFGQIWEDATGKTLPKFEVDFFVTEGNLKVGPYSFQVIHTPGHAPGSLSFYWEDGRVLFTGDVIFVQSFGRFDLPGADPVALIQSIEKLVQLDTEFLAPGHGPMLQGRGSVKENFYIVLGLFQQMVAREMKKNNEVLQGFPEGQNRNG
ncbi:MBL fold metallo-hydrolase [Thermodesulforhabdus norvegica]|uniref:Glyoxylase, beta-lactamase superfamily II n=1 Tax=Thermodesulforhabdus norvegica TaxID=39841 RepID=A0A1I4SKN7_9BACT|nr:MBL fold metallo-hydrolase [Thermodesulforhabdus norvegica]SFM64833.1 Glyoxylase, beta-lactamase superfamily II [Thermodesulforhabdus norvegica]